MGSFFSSDACKSIRPMYIFTVLAFLLGGVLFIITHHEAEFSPSVAALMNIIAGGLLTLLGTVVNYEFGSAKPREPLKSPPGTTVDATVITSTTTQPETKS